MDLENLAIWLVRVLGIYVGLGVAFAVPFVLRGAAAIDPAARGASWGFRWIVFPGVVAFWPLLLSRWLRRAPPPAESNAHRRAAGRGGAGG